MESTASRKTRQASGVEYPEWYAEARCPGSPCNPMRVLKYARRILEKDFQQDFDFDQGEDLALATLMDCFAHFEPARGDQDIPEDRFMRFFRHCFCRKLRFRVTAGEKT